MSKTLSAYERWMVRSNLDRIAAGEASADTIVQTLLANGYVRVGNAVAAATK